MALIGRRRRTDDDITVRRADQRSLTEYDGIRTLHSFSAGAHYDPDNVAFGALVGVDEHELAPGARFERHAHRGVTIISWVLDGTLAHHGAESVLVPSGTALVQATGSGIEHVEANASDTEPLRFVQLTVTEDVPAAGTRAGVPPIGTGAVLFDVLRDGSLIIEAERAHLYVAAGQFAVQRNALYPGDSLRASQEAITVEGSGELLVLVLR